MPYYISDKQSDCSGWATLKVVAGKPSTIACHSTKTEAIKHMVALSLAEKISPAGEYGKRAESYKPPMGVRVAAKRALAWIADGKAGSGFTDVGRARASQLASGESVSSDTISRMKSYFARHEVDKKATGFRSGEDGFPTPGRVAWDAWGGDAGQSWVNGLADGRDLRKAGGKKAIICDIDDTLIHSGRRIDKTYNYLESLNVDVLLVTGRPESTRDATTKQLADLDISYNRLYMNPGSSANSNAFKKAKAEELLKTYDIVEAIENNPDARRGYADLGIATKDPAKLPMMEHQDTGNGNSDQQRTIMTDAKLRSVNRAERILATLRKINGIKPTAETRVADVEFEIRGEGDKITFSGYAAVFNSDSHPLPFIERIAPGAFKRSLQARNDVKLLWNHDSGEVLASTRANTMRLIEDAHGLRVEADIAPTTRGKDLSILMKRGDINKMSFGFTVQQDSWSPDGNTRTLESVRLIEVSVVTFPAYESSVAQVRSLDEIDTDKLSDALLALETSDSLTPDQAGLLENVIKQLTKGEAPVEETVIEEVSEEPVTMIGLLQKKHTLEGKML
jgi:HK97 family phage prohead protease